MSPLAQAGAEVPGWDGAGDSGPAPPTMGTGVGVSAPCTAMSMGTALGRRDPIRPSCHRASMALPGSWG